MKHKAELKDDPLIFRPVSEWFMGEQKDNNKVIRVVTLLAMGMLGGSIVSLAMVVSMERSAMHHQCEQNYVLWPMAVTNLVLYSIILSTYFMIGDSRWARRTGRLYTFFLMLMVGWWIELQVRMAHICNTFYSIKYPLLQTSMNYCGFINFSLMMLFGFRECAMVFTFGTEDDTTFTQVFYKQNEAFVPSLFVKDKIESYKEGVESWGNCSQDRNESLKATLEKADKIHHQSRNQSQLLNQLTDVVKEADKKITKADSLIKDQQVLVQDLKVTVDGLENQLKSSAISSSTEGSWVGCNYSDIFKWTGLSLMCCLSVAMVLLSIPKWLHLFGISFGITI